jgi:hypothetical protein
MAYDSTKPAIADNYSTGYTQNIRDNFNYVLRWGEGDSVTGTPPTNAKRYNVSSGLFERYTGSAWVTMTLNYLALSGGGTVAGTVNFSGTLQVSGQAVWHPGNFTPSSKANNADPAMTGNGTIAGTFAAGGRLFGNGATSNNGIGKITVSTSDPSGGSQGDIWFKHA